MDPSLIFLLGVFIDLEITELISHWDANFFSNQPCCIEAYIGKSITTPSSSFVFSNRPWSGNGWTFCLCYDFRFSSMGFCFDRHRPACLHRRESRWIRLWYFYLVFSSTWKLPNWSRTGMLTCFLASEELSVLKWLIGMFMCVEFKVPDIPAGIFLILPPFFRKAPIFSLIASRSISLSFRTRKLLVYVFG